MRKIKLPKPEDFFLSIIVNLIASVITLLLLPYIVTIAEIGIPVFIALLFVNDLLILMAISVFRKKEEPVIRLTADLKMCIDDFGKYFRHPHYAIIPNPFSKEPVFWKYYYDSFAYSFHSWYSSFRGRFEKERTDMDIEELVIYSNEFYEIVKHYLMYANSFRALAKKHPAIPSIRDQFNRKFVDEFNHIFRPDFIKFLKNLQRETGEGKITVDIGSAAPLEVEPKQT